MFSTKSVQSLKNLFARYHEPAALSKTQSEKLLNALKTSFRRQLDKEYGSSHTPPPSAQSIQSTRKLPKDDESTRHSVANRHLDQLLSNPLFTYKVATPAATKKPRSHQKDPMEVFDHGVDQGLMTLQAATGCLFEKARQLKAQDPQGRLIAVDVALRVVRWLNSSGKERSLKFLEHKLFVKSLIPFLVAEGMEGTFWKWLSRSVQADASTKTKPSKRSLILLSSMVSFKSGPSHDLDAAVEVLLQTQDMFRDNPLLPELLISSWRSISWFSTAEAQQQQQQQQEAVSEKPSDALIANAPSLPPAMATESAADLNVQHPTNPDPQSTHQFFIQLENLRDVLKRGSEDEKRRGARQWLSSYLSESDRPGEPRTAKEASDIEFTRDLVGKLKPG